MWEEKLFPVFSHYAGTITSPESGRTGHFVELPAQISIKLIVLKSLAVTLVYLKALPGNRVPATWRRNGRIGFCCYYFHKDCPCPKPLH